MTKCNLPQFNIHNVFSWSQNKYIDEFQWGLDYGLQGNHLISRLFIFFTVMKAPVCIGNKRFRSVRRISSWFSKFICFLLLF
jgi:hypothetical protein